MIDPAAGTEDTPLFLKFDDNTLLPMLFGEHDRHLARVEQELGVSLVSRGNQVVITGSAWPAEVAKTILNGLYARLKEGAKVDGGEVEAALRLARQGEYAATDGSGEPLVIATQKRSIAPRSRAQGAYIRALRETEMVFATGPAGTGKTYLAVAMASAMLNAAVVERIILSRPAVEAGESLGYLPGDLREKVDPYLRPLYDALYDMMPGDKVRRRLENGDIEVAPLAFMRGRTLSNAYVILDEAQNTTPVQMKMFLTRMGEKSRMVVTGDLSQVDLPRGARSGLRDAIDTLDDVVGITKIAFSDNDVVRHGLVTRIVRAYDRKESEPRGKTPP